MGSGEAFALQEKAQSSAPVKRRGRSQRPGGPPGHAPTRPPASLPALPARSARRRGFIAAPRVP